MPEQDFTNREIVLMFEQIKNELAHIKEQTTKTNGRLLKAEDKIEGFHSFQIKVTAVYGVVASLILFAANKFI